MRDQVLLLTAKAGKEETTKIMWNMDKMNYSTMNCLTRPICLFVWGFTPYQPYFSYLTAKPDKSIFPGLF